MAAFKTTTILAATVVALAGCAPTLYFDKPGATNQSFNADKLECLDVGNRAPQTAAFGSIYLIAAVSAANRATRQEFFSTCMQAKGYAVSTTPTTPP
jgi:hypothetical protein